MVPLRVIRRRATVARKAACTPDNAHGRGATGDSQVAEIVVLPVVEFAGAGGGASGTEVVGAEAVFLASDAWGLSVRLLGSGGGWAGRLHALFHVLIMCSWPGVEKVPPSSEPLSSEPAYFPVMKSA